MHVHFWGIRILNAFLGVAIQMLLESDRSEIFVKAMKDGRQGGLSTRKEAQR